MATIQARIIRADGTEEIIEGKLTLEVMQKTVGGYIEVMTTNKGKRMVMNEDGRRLGLPYNAKATEYAIGMIPSGDTILGDVIIATRREI
jgi:hypothetical protein